MRRDERRSVRGRRGGRHGVGHFSIYQDGIELYDASLPGPPLDFARMTATDYTAAEFYAGGAESPPEFNATAAGCGTLLLWTRLR